MQKGQLLVLVAVFSLGLILGRYSVNTDKVTVIASPEAKPVVIKATSEQEVTVARQPKEDVASPDIKVNASPVDILLEANGQEFILPAKADTTKKLENDQLQILTTAKAILDISDLVDKAVSNAAIAEREKANQELEKLRIQQKKKDRQNVIRTILLVGATYLVAK